MSGHQYKHKCRYIVFCCMFLIIMTGCAKAPQEVLDEINGTKEQQESVDNLEQADESIVYTKVSELSESVPEYMTTTIGNLSFDGTITVPDTDCLYDLRLVANTSFYDNRDTLIPDILAWYQIPYEDENIEIECWVDNESGTFIGLWDGARTEDYPLDFIHLLVSGLKIQISDDGSLILWLENREYEGGRHYLYENEYQESCETWHLWNHEIPEIGFVLDEENVSLQELYDDFSQVVELYNSQNDSLGLQIYSASYYLTGNQDSCMELDAVQTYRGVCFDPICTTVDIGGRSLVSGRLRGKYHYRADRCQFGLYNSSYMPVEELAVYGEVVSFESALSSLAKRLGNYYTADVDEAALFYLRYYYGSHGASWHLGEEELITAYAHPYWRFVERWNDKTDASERTVYYVDAITGEVMCLYENCAIY